MANLHAIQQPAGGAPSQPQLRVVKRRPFPKFDGDQRLISFHPPTASRFERGMRQLQLQDYSEAKQHFLAAIRSDPESKEAHYHLGYCEGKLGNATAAKANFERAIILGLDSPEAHFNLGIAQGILKDYFAAADSFSKAINRSKNPDDGLFLARCRAYTHLALDIEKLAEARKDGRGRVPREMLLKNWAYATMACLDALPIVREQKAKGTLDKRTSDSLELAMLSFIPISTRSYGPDVGEKTDGAYEAERKRALVL